MTYRDIAATLRLVEEEAQERQRQAELAKRKRR